MFMKFLCNPSTALTVGCNRYASTRGGFSRSSNATFTTALVPQGEKMSHQTVEDLCRVIRSSQSDRTVVVDMQNVEDASTAAFAKLVLLRRELLGAGRDLRLKGMRTRVASIWRISRLSTVLPVQ